MIMIKNSIRIVALAAVMLASGSALAGVTPGNVPLQFLWWHVIGFF